MKNKHIIVGGLVILFAINVIGAKIIGNNLENGIKTAVAAYSEQLRINIDVANFKSGWFSSSFQLKLNIPATLALPIEQNLTTDQSAIKNGQIIFDQIIDHGPIAFTSHGPRIGLAFWQSNSSLTDEFRDRIIVTDDMTEEQKQDFNEFWPQLKEISKVELRGSAGLFGGISNAFHLEGGKINFEQNGEGVNILLKPADIEWSLSRGYDASDIDLILHGMDINSSDGTNINIGEISAIAELERIKPGIWLGDSVMHISPLDGEGPNNAKFNYAGLDATSRVNVDLDTNNFSIDVSYNSHELNFQSPENNIDFDGFKIDLSISEIPFSLIETFMDISEKIQNADATGLMQLDRDFTEQILALDYKGIIKAHLSIAPVKADINQELKSGSLDFSPFELSYTLSNDIRESDLILNWQGMNLDMGGPGNLSVESITSKTHQFAFNTDLWLGNTEAQILNINYISDKNSVFRLDRFDFNGDMVPAGDDSNTNGTFTNQIDNMIVENEQGTFIIRNLNSEWSLVSIPNELRELYQDYTDPFQIERIQNPELVNQQAAEKLASIQLQPTLTMNQFDLTLNEGNLDMSAIAEFEEPFLIGDQYPMSFLILNGKLNVSESFFKDIVDIMAEFNPMMATMTSEQRAQMAQGMVTQFSQQGLITAQGDRQYGAEISTANSFITFNGQPVFPLITPPVQ